MRKQHRGRLSQGRPQTYLAACLLSLPLRDSLDGGLLPDVHPRSAVSIRQTFELGVTGSHQNAPTATDARGPILAPSANHIDRYCRRCVLPRRRSCLLNRDGGSRSTPMFVFAESRRRIVGRCYSSGDRKRTVCPSE